VRGEISPAPQQVPGPPTNRYLIATQLIAAPQSPTFRRFVEASEGRFRLAFFSNDGRNCPSAAQRSTPHDQRRLTRVLAQVKGDACLAALTMLVADNVASPRPAIRCTKSFHEAPRRSSRATPLTRIGHGLRARDHHLVASRLCGWPGQSCSRLRPSVLSSIRGGAVGAGSDCGGSLSPHQCSAIVPAIG